MSTQVNHPSPLLDHVDIDPVPTLLSEFGECSSTHAQSPIIRINALAFADAHTGILPQGSLLTKHTCDGLKILEADTALRINQLIENNNLPAPSVEITLRNQVVLPAFVNAHTHLDLTHIGPVEHNPADGFVKWVDMIRTNRAQTDQEIENAVRMGINASFKGGTIAVGDIAGAPAGRLTNAPAKALTHSAMMGTSFIEFFGIGKTKEIAIDKLKQYASEHDSNFDFPIEDSGIRVGLQPHAPNTVDFVVYQYAASLAAKNNWLLSTHLAETREEREFIETGLGPQRVMLERLGVWDDEALHRIGIGNHPVKHLMPILSQTPMLVAHVNDATDDAIELLASTDTSVAYCPQGSSYFGAHDQFGPHRYRDMINAGINVCVGTDSIVNLPFADRISILDEIRFLWHRDQAPMKTLLAMATTNGAKALQIHPDQFMLKGGSVLPGLLSLEINSASSDEAELWKLMMKSDSLPDWIYLKQP